MKRTLMLFLPLVGVFIMAACGGGTPSSDGAVRAVEQYLMAKVAGNRDAMAPHICSSMEAMLDAEAMSFSAVEARIDGLTCRVNDGANTVTCDGQIVATYGLETRDFPLGTYSVVEEDGVWKWCGETR